MIRPLRALTKVDRIGEAFACVAACRNWPSIISRYLGVSKQYPVAFRTRSGLSLELENFHDLVTAWVVFCRREYVLPRGAKLIVDLGSNIGTFALFARTFCPDSTVFAFEPFPTTQERLLRTLTANSLEGLVQPLCSGVGAVRGTRWMAADGPSQSRGIQPIESRQSPSGVSVTVQTLPDLIDAVQAEHSGSQVDFLKIDIEGAEHEVLGSLPEGCLEAVEEIGMEYHPNSSKKTLFETVVRQGYSVVKDRQFGQDTGVVHFRRVR